MTEEHDSGSQAQALSLSSRALFDAAAGGDEPKDADRERVRRMLAERLAMGASVGAAAALGAGAKAGAVASGAGKSALLGLTAKLTLTALVAAGLGTATVVGVRAAQRHQVAPAEVVARTASRRGAWEGSGPRTEAPLEDAPAVTATALPEGMPAPMATLPLPPPRKVRVRPVPTLATAASDTPEEPSAHLGEQTALLRTAHAALAAGDAAHALQSLDAYGRQFPHGALAEDRDALRVRALCESGRQDEAREAAATFARSYPGSAHIARVQAACASTETPL